MSQSLQLGSAGNGTEQPAMRRLNRLPVIVVIVFVAIVLGVIVIGLSWRGITFNRSGNLGESSNAPATSFGDQLKRGVTDGIIGEPEQREVFQPTPVLQRREETRERPKEEDFVTPERHSTRLEQEDVWKARLKREQDEQIIREAQRQRMARLQARSTALESPLTVDIGDVPNNSEATDRQRSPVATVSNDAGDFYEAAMKAGFPGANGDQNGQAAKEDFFNQDIKELGYLPNKVVSQISRFELKRGSVIPATLITGLNSDLPGRITAQVSQNVYDSASGHRLLIPQGAKLFGRYDSKVSFGQERVLVVWSDLIFPNGSTLQIGGMAGTDAEGYGGFKDKVDRHLWRTFGSAALVAVIGTGIDMSLPESSSLATQDTASDAARRNFAETFGRMAEQTISKNLNVQPTIMIRPGYRFNVMVDQDIVFPSAYR
ncbi:IncP-type conjugal transfer protein TrbI [Rhizobiales bacterium RZME27]|uniref:IncP-type conjugal transfer protein TrbI n=1 Tax=Endobacterium cereale TaxID=2663029 RepID=A0A6A8A984_9HYPH|nr:IncP-type conjugal transfer protein TrbI [Endobacterium cereale]MEB2846617.1 IncP-type conjugal transfer protein TrbI [Endobacterium cereale]MQY46458.1 IncP-type conjugal transfer protein TrbI [Endobacterium cereale]